MTMATAPGGSYPVRFDVAYPENLSRGLIFIKWLLAIPHFIILYALNLVFEVLTFIAFFAVIITGKYPDGLFKFNVGTRRWFANVYAYIFLLRDEYPPFSFDEGAYPVTLQIDYPDKLGRFAPLYQWLLAIPHIIIVYVLLLIVFVTTFIAWFAILFTGKYPDGLFKFAVGVWRWTYRAGYYAAFLSSEYPPFSLDA